MKKDCFILRWPASLHVLASKHPLWNLCFLLPILFMAALGMRDLVAQKSYLALAFFLAAGALYWSFIEYAIHRWVYHSYLPLPRLRFFLDSFHAYHHSDLTDHRVLTAGPLMIYVLALQLLLPFYFLLSWPLLCAFAFGTLAYYHFYEWIHYLIHYRAYGKEEGLGYLHFIQRYHMFHHYRAPKKNFGNTSALWDRLLGTYDARYALWEAKEFRNEHFITKNSAGQANTPINNKTSYDYPQSFRFLEYVALFSFALLFFAFLLRLPLDSFARAGQFLWSYGAAFILAWLAADLISALVHWFADTWGSKKWFLLGPTLIRSFREHHVDPTSILRHDFVETNGASALVSLPLLLAAHFLLPALVFTSGFESFVAVFFWSLAFWVLLTNQIHKWAHAGKRAPLFAKALQWLGLFLPCEEHLVHHTKNAKGEFTESYAITSGLSNFVLNQLRFFRALEFLVKILFGAEPRVEDRALQVNAPGRRRIAERRLRVLPYAGIERRRHA